MPQIQFSDESFDLSKEKAENGYKSIGEVFSPYLKRHVHFNTHGLRHLKFKSWRKMRSKEDQFMRFKLLHLAPVVITKSSTLQGITKTHTFERQSINSRWEKRLKQTTYYEFIAVFEPFRIKIIVKEIEGGELFFWSIVPFWRMDRSFQKRILSSTKNPETD